MIEGQEFLDGIPIRVSGDSVTVIHRNDLFPNQLVITTTLPLLRRGITVLRSTDPNRHRWPWFMRALTSIPQLASVYAFEDRVILELNTSVCGSWKPTSHVLVPIFKRALKSARNRRRWQKIIAVVQSLLR